MICIHWRELDGRLGLYGCCGVNSQKCYCEGAIENCENVKEREDAKTASKLK